MQKRKLFLSLSSFVRHFVSGNVSFEESRTALFYFGIPRAQRDNGLRKDVEGLVNQPSQQSKVIKDLKAALDAAESERRISWKVVDETDGWSRLSKFCHFHGMPGLPERNEGTPFIGRNVAVAISDRDIPLTVIWF